ncbi:hypothetical protein FRB90_004861 [Tulasnella sp. 427]|nr:hypothetical protein FRB90_004861 [Tulasnella sp. 427]
MMRANSSRHGSERHYRRERRASDSSGSVSDADSDYYDHNVMSPGNAGEGPSQAKGKESATPPKLPPQSMPDIHLPEADCSPGPSNAHPNLGVSAMASGSSIGLGFGSTHSLTGSARFRASAQRLIRMRRIAAASQPGAEPGVDAVRDSPEYDHIRANCHIDVIEYGQERSSFHEFDNKGFLQYLSSVGKAKDDWAKADYYRDQLFVQGLALLLVDAGEDSDDFAADGTDIGKEFDVTLHEQFHPSIANGGAASGTSISETAVNSGHTNDRGRSWLGQKLFGHHAKEAAPDDLEAGRSPYGRTPVPPQRNGDSKASPTQKQKDPPLGLNRRKRQVAEQRIEKLRGDKRVKVRERNMYIFMFRDGTLITLHESKESVNDAAIKERLKEPNTLLRGTSEVSVLLHGLIDLMVDHAIQVVDAFQDQILYLEQETLLRPQMDLVKLLHMLSADITLHKRALKPLQSLVYGMRRYDLDRCVAIAASVNGVAPDPSKVKGFLSHQAKVYLADVHDHLEYVIASLEMFETVTENLISYSFNVLSYDMNEIMRRLTLATLIFFPLTFISGYFGMNFTQFSSIEGSDLLFWKIALPSMAGLVLMFCWSDVKRLFKYMFAVKNLPQRVTRPYTKIRVGLGGSVLKNHRSRA